MSPRSKLPFPGDTGCAASSRLLIGRRAIVFGELCSGLCPLLIKLLVSLLPVQLGSSGWCALHVHPSRG